MNRLRKLLPILIGLLCCTTVNGQDFYSDGFYYYITSSTDLTVAVYDVGGNVRTYSGEVVIPEVVMYNNNTYRVTEIESEAFYNCNFTSVVIPNGVTEIGEAAFYGCSRLASIIIPNSVVKIRSYVFDDTAWYENQPDGVVYAGNVLYKYKGEMPEETSIEIRKGTTCIAADAFKSCKKLISITIPNSVNSIGYAAFLLCSSLTSITIPNSVTEIESSAFSGCTNLASITILGDVSKIGSYAFENTAWYKNQPDGIVYAGKVLYEYKGYNMPEGTSIEISEGTIGIAGGAFSSQRNLTSVTIPESVVSIGDYAFSYCSGLTSITIPNSVTEIGDCAFSNCSSLTSITIPKSVTKLGDRPFVHCEKLNKIQVDKDNKVYDSRNDCNAIIETASNTLLLGCASTVIPNTVKTIGWYAFSSAPSYIAVPSSVNSIEENAFEGCSELCSIIIPKSVNYIGESAFFGCSELSSITILNDDVIIDSDAFYDTEWFDNQPDGVVYIGNILYSYKGEIPENTSITVREGTRSVVSCAFYDCSNLISVTIPEGVTNIGVCAFEECSNLTSIVLPKSLTTLGVSAFYDCSSLTSMNIPEGVTSIPKYAFYGCTSLSTIVLPKNLTDINPMAFSWCPRVQDVYCYAVDVPRAESDAFEDSYPEYATLHVPASAIESYRNTAPWSNFGKIVPLEEGSNIITQSASPVFIQCGEGVITLTDLAEDTEVTVYDTAGRKLGSAIATNRTATINTNLTMGSAAIVKFAGRSVKVIMK